MSSTEFVQDSPLVFLYLTISASLPDLFSPKYFCQSAARSAASASHCARENSGHTGYVCFLCSSRSSQRRSAETMCAISLREREGGVPDVFNEPRTSRLAQSSYANSRRKYSNISIVS